MPYAPAVVERTMKVQEVLMQAISGKLTWLQAEEILGWQPRTLRRWRLRYEQRGYDGLWDRRRQQPSPRRAPVAEVARIVRLYRERYTGFNAAHFHEIAQREHRQFVSVLKRFARVHQVRDLLTEILQQPDARDYLITKTMDVVPQDALARRLEALPAEEIVTMLIEGTEEESGPISRSLNEVGFAFPPLPNLFFPRDIGMVIGEHAVVGSMRYGVRWTEELLIKALFHFHPELANAGFLYDGSEERRDTYTLEGGDVHYLRPDLLVLGFSERTSPAALDQLCETVFERGQVTDVLVVVMPKVPTAIHLDMIFSQIDHDLGVVYPPFFVGPERLPVLHRRKGTESVQEMPNFFAALRTVGLPLGPEAFEAEAFGKIDIVSAS